MIKRHHYISFTIVLGAFVAIYFIKNHPPGQNSLKSIPQKSKKTTPIVDTENLKIDGKRVIGLPPGHEKEEIMKIRVANNASQDWEPNLKETLKLQGGNSLKEISLKKVDSFVWAQDGMALYVESVIVNLVNDKNARTTFRVLVDSQTGKILKNWDQPIFDPVHPKDNFKVRIDPRYHNESN